MLRIATVEDDANDLEALRTHLSRYEKENGLKFQVTEFRGRRRYSDRLFCGL